MGSPTKQRWKQGVQQQILTNYYISKYDRFMSRMNEKKVQTTFSQRLPHQAPASNNTKRKNFKQLIRQKKAQRNGYGQHQSPTKTNFKIEMQKKSSKQKVEKQNRKNFYMLEDTIMNQLYKPSPSPIERAKNTQIQVVHKVYYDDRRQKVQPFRLTSNFDGSEQENIEINYQEHEHDDNQTLQISYEKVDHQRIQQAIRSSFQKRKSPTKSKSKGKQQKLPPKSPSFKLTQKNNHSQSNSREDSYFYENVRPSFENMQQQNNYIFEHHDQQQQSLHIEHKQKLMETSFGDDDRKSLISRHQNSQKNKSMQRIRSKRISRKSSITKQIQARVVQKKQNNQIQDSFHQNIPEIEQEPKISMNNSHEKQSEKQKQSQKSDALHSHSQHHHSQNKSMKSSRFHNQSDIRDKDSLHQFSMISRFSMTSDEGGHIREELEKQLGENQFGPYQNALTSLLDLIGEFPHAWPIFVVGQRILDDRHQYENRRMLQQSQISKLQGRIQAMKRKKLQITAMQDNKVKILQLIRQLGQKFPEHHLKGY